MKFQESVDNYIIVTTKKTKTNWITTITIFNTILEERYHKGSITEAHKYHDEVVKNVYKRCRVCGTSFNIFPHPTKGWLCHEHKDHDIPQIKCQKCSKNYGVKNHKGWLCDPCNTEKWYCLDCGSRLITWNPSYKIWECANCATAS